MLRFIDQKYFIASPFAIYCFYLLWQCCAKDKIDYAEKNEIVFITTSPKTAASIINQVFQIRLTLEEDEENEMESSQVKIRGRKLYIDRTGAGERL